MGWGEEKPPGTRVTILERSDANGPAARGLGLCSEQAARCIKPQTRPAPSPITNSNHGFRRYAPQEGEEGEEGEEAQGREGQEGQEEED
eukprot:1192940-Rhodomonas_salina.1